jgi:hypothetical protein
MSYNIIQNEKVDKADLKNLEFSPRFDLPLQIAILASLKDFDIENINNSSKQDFFSTMPKDMPMAILEEVLQANLKDLKAVRENTFKSLSKAIMGNEPPVEGKLALLSKNEEAVGVFKLSLEENYNPVLTPVLELKPGEKPVSNVPSWAQMQKNLLFAQLQEILEELSALQKAGGEYPIAYIITVSIAIISSLSIQLQELTAKPLEHYQEISKRQAILKEKIEQIKKKELSGQPITKEDVQGLKDAIKELDAAVDKLAEAYTFEDNDGNKIIIWPNDEIRDVYEKAKANVNMMKGEKINGTDRTIENIDLDDPEQLLAALSEISRWAGGANSNKPAGPFVQWDSGKDGAIGNSVMKIILDTEISTFTDRLNREAQLISSAQSMGQKQVEHASSLMKGIVSNFTR